jgi:hypothetical protein
MAGLIRVLVCLVLLVGAVGALSVGAADALTEVGAGGNVVVAVFSTNADLAAEHVPVLREPCGPRLSSLRKAGFKITNVQGGGGLLYTLESDGPKGDGGVVILGCVPLPEETTPPDNPT